MKKWLYEFCMFICYGCIAFVISFLASTGFFAAKNAYDLSGSVAQIKYENHVCFVAKGNMECFKND